MNAVSTRLRAWWLSRLSPAERWTLTQRNVYIVPTRAGLAFGVTLVVLLLASINYQLNLGYALTFLLAGSALASMHMAHGSLRGLSLHLRPVAPCFAGGAVTLDIVVSNPGAARHGLGFGCEEQPPAERLAWAEVEARGQTTVSVRQPCPRRGLRALPVLRVESRFPFGLFRAWTVWRPAGTLCVYPAPEAGPPPLPTPPPSGHDGGAAHTAQGSEFDGVRPWRRGDSPRQVVWKKVAHSGELVSREQREPLGRTAWLDWQDAQLGDTEARLSRLAAWVLAADAGGAPWGLRLPGSELAPDQGDSHRHAALRALAEWPA